MRYVFLALGLVLVAIGHGLGLFWAPPEAMMGDVGRILYVHVPTAWNAMVVYLIAFVAAAGTLWNGRDTWDATVEAAVELGIVYNAMLLMQGSIWARPTWGVWWTWDPRLTTTAVMVITYIGVLVLRGLIQEHERRKTVTAVATVVAVMSVLLTYFSVKLWNTLHQDFSSPETVSDPMILPLRIAAFGMLFLAIGCIGIRRRIALDRLVAEGVNPDLPPAPEPLELGAR